MPRKKGDPPGDQPSLLEARVTTAPCVPQIRKAVAEWRDAKYKGATDTTKLLLNHWFAHRPPAARRRSFRVLPCAAGGDRDAGLPLRGRAHPPAPRSLERYANVPGIHRPAVRRLRPVRHQDGDRQRQDQGHVARHRLAVLQRRRRGAGRLRTLLPRRAPNVIVFERLRADFAGGRIFRADPVIPPELAHLLGLRLLHARRRASGPGRRAPCTSPTSSSSTSAPDRRSRRAGRDDRRARPEAADERSARSRNSTTRIAARGAPCIVLNDEGHHTHDEDSEWNQVIRRLHDDIARGPARTARRLGDTALRRRAGSSPGRSTTIRSSRRSSTTSSSAR